MINSLQMQLIVLAVVLGAAVVCAEDFYELLRVSRDATLLVDLCAK